MSLGYALLVAKGKVTAGELAAMFTYLTVAHSLLSACSRKIRL